MPAKTENNRIIKRLWQYLDNSMSFYQSHLNIGVDSINTENYQRIQVYSEIKGVILELVAQESTE